MARERNNTVSQTFSVVWRSEYNTLVKQSVKLQKKQIDSSKDVETTLIQHWEEEEDAGYTKVEI